MNNITSSCCTWTCC